MFGYRGPDFRVHKKLLPEDLLCAGPFWGRDNSKWGDNNDYSWPRACQNVKPEARATSQ